MRPPDADDLVGRVAGGDRSAAGTLLDALGESTDTAERARLLDPLARTAGSSGHALEVLVTAVDRFDLAVPAIRNLVVSPQDVEEVAQDVLIAVSTSVDGYRADARFTTWLSAVARNTTIAYLRRQRDAAVLDDDAPVSNAARLSSMVATRASLRAAIDELEPIYREPLVLRDVEQQSYQAVADRLGLNLNTAKSRIFRARAMLAGRLAPDERPDV